MDGLQAAFMSYSQADDRNNGNFISKLREKLSDEVQGQRGQAFNIFQDKVNLTVGDNWKRVLYETLDKVSFLIPIMTPNFFTSEACREEVAYFLKREKRLHRDDLILPIYFINSEIVNSPDRRDSDPSAAAIYEQLSSRQRSDWRDLRGLSISAPAVKKKIIRLASEITLKIGNQDLGDTLQLKQAKSSCEDANLVSSSPDSTRGLTDHSATTRSGVNTRLRLVPPSLENFNSPWSELAQALSRVDLTPADSSLIAVRTKKIRGLMHQDYPQLGERNEEIRYVKGELSDTINSIVLVMRSATENAVACRVADRLRSLLISLISEAL